MMTPETLAPSADVAKAATTPKMRFLYPLAAVLACAVFLAPNAGEAQTPKLRPDQQRAIEAALKDVEPAMRPMAREQLAKTFASFSEPQIAMMMAKMEENRKAEAAKPVPVKEEPKRPATPADLAYNRAQFEPVIRKHHAAQKRFDEFANAKLAAYCPGRDDFARFGSGWRYEQGEFMQPSSLATWNVDSNVEIAGQAYAPQDGRYNFDFSKVRMTFDEKAVDAAISQACDQVKARGKEFLAKVDPLLAKKDWDGAFLAEGSAQGKLEPIRTELKAKFDKLSPGDFTEIQMALMNGKPVN
jgi:hypothetical protein